ncbi:MAG TPA: maleylpyruvate isomerase N-terminal domain-containing protein [Thermoanaerobaculia bacterium]
MVPGRAAPLAPTLVAHLFPPLGRELVALLRSLDAAAWQRPTVCPAWSVHDVAAHLLDTACRRLSFGRDGHTPPAGRIDDYGELLRLLDRLNAEWVAAARRLSPRLLTDLLEWVEPQLAERLARLDPWADGVPVAWAGETRSPSWFDVARELTERWHHQQQIRLAVGAPPLADPETSEAVFDTFLRGLPHRYRDVAAPEGTAIAIAIHGARTYAYTLRRAAGSWQLLKGAEPGPAAAVALDEEPAWLLLTKGMPEPEARARAEIAGDPGLAAPLFGLIAVMA